MAIKACLKEWEIQILGAKPQEFQVLIKINNTYVAIPYDDGTSSELIDRENI